MHSGSSIVIQAAKDRTVTNDDYANLLATVKVAETTPTPASDFHGGQKTVGVPGTCEALSSSTPCVAILVKALSTNGGLVYVGDNTLSADQVELSAKEAVTLGLDNLNKVYVDAVNAGEGVCYAYLV